MKWALIYMLGTAGTFETGLTFDNYAECIHTHHQAINQVSGVSDWAKGEQPTSHLLTPFPEVDVSSSADWAKGNSDQVGEGPKYMHIDLWSEMQEEMMAIDHRLSASSHVYAVCLPTE